MSAQSYPIRRFTPEKSSLGRLFARDSVVRRMDWLLLFATLLLCLIGTLLVYSATRNRTDLTHGDQYYFLLRHVMNAGIGLGLAIGAMAIGHHRMRNVVPFFYALSILGILAVLSPLGSTINGAHAWIVIGGGFSIQPAEFVKVAIIIGMAMVLSARVDAGDKLHPDHRTVLQALGLAALPVAIIMMMPDLGSVMVLAAIVLGVLLASGASSRWVFGLIAAGVAGALLVWQLGILDKYQIDRFAAFANPALDPSGVGYNTSQARIAIGSGGLLGKGLFHGSQTTGQFVPEQQTDFVFSVAGEELGFVGSIFIIALIGVILWRACAIARGATDLYGTIVAAGIVAWFAFQSFENIGMAMGIMPVTGIPLPFVSYGGSSMFANFIALGLLQSVKMKRPMSA